MTRYLKLDLDEKELFKLAKCKENSEAALTIAKGKKINLSWKQFILLLVK